MNRPGEMPQKPLDGSQQMPLCSITLGPQCSPTLWRKPEATPLSWLYVHQNLRHPVQSLISRTGLPNVCDIENGITCPTRQTTTCLLWFGIQKMRENKNLCILPFLSIKQISSYSSSLRQQRQTWWAYKVPDINLCPYHMLLTCSPNQTSASQLGATWMLNRDIAMPYYRRALASSFSIYIFSCFQL